MSYQFLLDDETSLFADTVLRRAFSARAERNGNGWTLPTAQNLKREALEAGRQELILRLCSWLRQRVPGEFLEVGDVPVTEFWTFDLVDPLEPIAAPRLNSYIEMLGMGGSPEIWRCGDLPGLGLFEVESRGRQSRRTLLGGQTQQLLDALHPMYGKTPDGVIGQLSQLEPLMAYLALDSLLIRYHDQLTTMRDTPLTSSADLTAESANAALEIEAKLVRLRQNIPTLTRELMSAAKDAKWGHWYLNEWTRQIFKARPPVDLRETLRLTLDARARAVSDLERDVRDALLFVSTARSTAANEQLARTNVVLQTRLERLTRVLLWLTVVMVLVSLAQLWVSLKLTR